MTDPAPRPRRVLWVLLVAYSLFLAVVLLIPRGDVPSRSVDVITELVQGWGADPGLFTAARMEILLNVLIMVPLALLGRLLRPGYSWRDWTAVGFIIATGVEVFQGFFLPERSASAVDVVANTTGVAVGAAIGSAARLLGRRRSGTAVTDGGRSRGSTV